MIANDLAIIAKNAAAKLRLGGHAGAKRRPMPEDKGSGAGGGFQAAAKPHWFFWREGHEEHQGHEEV